MEKITSLCFSGGALKGIAYCGVLKYLEEINILPQINHYSGTSIGAFFALITNIGYSSKEMEIFALNFNYNLLEDINLSYFLQEYGLSSSKKIERMIKRLLSRKGFNEEITFSQLHTRTNAKLSIVCCKLNDFTPVVFDYLTFPDFPVYIACKMSMSIPVIFTKNSMNQDYLVDGMFYKNLPIELHDPESTIGFCLMYPGYYSSITSLGEYLLQINKCMFKKTQDLELQVILQKGYRVVIIESLVNSLDPDLPKEERKKLIELGYSCAVNQLTNFKIGSN